MSATPYNASVASPAVEPLAEAAPAKPAAKHTYGQILKSSALIGGSSAVNIAIGIVRTKAMALLLGPAGVGLLGLYGSIVDVTLAIAGMGINSSGVRQIAESVGSGDTERIARTATVLRQTSRVLAIAGALLLVALCVPVSRLTFGTDAHAGAVALLSLAVFFRLVSSGQAALTQGMRRIGDLARMSILGAIYGTVISVPVVWMFGENGIVPSLVAVAAMTILTSWWYSRKIPIARPHLTMPAVREEAAALFKLGFAFMASAFMTMGSAYAIRIIVRSKIGFEAAGLYQSAWALGGMYVAFILRAMSTDFYPRLTGVAKDNAECNRLVNEQALVSLLLAGPGVIATLTFAPVVIALFYSTKFGPAADLLRWICLGMTLRVVAWPMGFIVLAKGDQKTFFWTEVAAAVVHVGLAFLLVGPLGLRGATVAFFGLYIWHGVLIYAIVRKLSGFRWSLANRQLALRFLPLIGLVFCAVYLLPFKVATAIGACASLVSGIYSVRVLVRLVPSKRIPVFVRQWLVRLRLADGSIL